MSAGFAEAVAGTDLEPRDARSLTFIPASLADNAILTRKDPQYRAILRSLPRVERERLEKGNWNVQTAKGDYFPRDAWRVVEAHEAPKNLLWTVRAWDKAASIPTPSYPDPDWTAGALVSGTAVGELVVWDLRRFRALPHGVKERLEAIAEEDGRGVPIALFQDPGQAGKVDIDESLRWLSGWTVFSERPVRGKASERPEGSGRPNPKITALGPLSSDVRHQKVTLVWGLGWTRCWTKGRSCRSGDMTTSSRRSRWRGWWDRR